MKKTLITLTLLLMSVLALTGCGISNNSSSGTADTSSSAGYPMTISHAYGDTTIESKPERVVAISWLNGDTPLALGVAPVGISEANYGNRTENRLHPWTDQAFKDLGIDQPNVFNDTDGWDYESIADADPDLIIAAYSGITQEEYELLSEIAPVIPYKEAAFQTSWRDQTIQNAEALGMKAEAEKLVEETDALIREKLAEHPAIQGKKTAFMWLSAEDLSTFYVYLPADPRAAFLEDLGMELPESVKNLAGSDDEFSITVSRENAEKLNDVEMIVTYGDENLLQAMQNDDILSQIPAVKNGAVVLLDQTTDIASGSTPSVLSIPYTIDDYLKLLEPAAKKVK